MLLGATHASSKIFQAIHVQSPTPVAWWKDTLALSQTLHPMNHLSLERATVVFLYRLARTLARS